MSAEEPLWCVPLRRLCACTHHWPRLQDDKCMGAMCAQAQACRARKLLEVTWGAMTAQERVLAPMPQYWALSAFDAAASKTLASPNAVTAVPSLARAHRSPQRRLQLAQAAFLRRVEQVRRLPACVVRVPCASGLS